MLDLISYLCRALIMIRGRSVVSPLASERFWLSVHMDKERSGSVCRLVHGFGLRTGVQDNVLCVDETTAIFPVGRALAQLNIETQVMSFVSEGERADLVLALALAPSRRFARVPF